MGSGMGATKQRVCRTCGSTYAVDGKAFRSTQFCCNLCEAVMDRYERAMRAFEVRRNAFERGELFTKPYPPKLHVPTEDERKANRVAMCTSYNRRCNRCVYVVSDSPDATDPPVDLEPELDEPVHLRRCHTCGTPTTRYWCKDCMEKRAKKYGFSMEDVGYYEFGE